MKNHLMNVIVNAHLTNLSIQYALEVLEELSLKIGQGLGRQGAYLAINSKIEDLKQQL